MLLMNRPVCCVFKQIETRLPLLLVKYKSLLCESVGIIIMATLRSRCEHNIFVLWFLLLLPFFHTYSQPSKIGCLPYFHAWRGLSANLECRSESELCCTRLTENTGQKKSPKNLPSGLHNFVSCVFATKACIASPNKNLLNSNISPSTCLRNMVNFGWHLFTSLGHHSRFQWVSHLAFFTVATLLTGGQPNFARCLAISCAGTLHIFGGSCPLTEFFPSAKFTLHTSKSCILLHWQRYCTALQQLASNFAAWYKEWNYGTLADGATYIRLGGHHIGHRPTFYLLWPPYGIGQAIFSSCGFFFVFFLFFPRLFSAVTASVVTYTPIVWAR